MDDRLWIGVGGLIVLVVLILLRFPIALAMMLVAFGGVFLLEGATGFLRFDAFLALWERSVWSTWTTYELSIIPLFFLMGFLAQETGIARDLFTGLRVVLQRVRGGIAMATILTCGGFGAVNGSSLATVGTMAQVARPELNRAGVAPGFANAVIAAGGTLGILIPPSLVLVIYALLVDISIVTMFQVAIVPGLIAVLFYCLVVMIMVRLRPDLCPADTAIEEAQPEEKRCAVVNMLPVLAVFSGLIGGLAIGLYTPTPAAAMSVLLIGLLALRRDRDTGLRGLNFVSVINAARKAASSTGFVMLIVLAAEMLKAFLVRTHLPVALAEWASMTTLHPLILLVAMLLLLLLLGTVLESLSLMVIVVPFLWPVLTVLNGGDFVTAESAIFGMTTEHLALWVGLLMLAVVELGLITPPVGLNLLILKSQVQGAEIKVKKRRCPPVLIWPFVGCEVVRIAVIMAFPDGFLP